LGGEAYRENRRLDQGRYLRTAALIEWHPDFSAEFAKPGIGARLSYERGDGTLQWQRAEVRATARKPLGPFVALARGDVGAVFGSRIPPQQLFELGKFQNLPGYDDKEFAGARAAVLRASLQYTSPYFRQPIRAGRFFLPALAPGLSVGVQSGWADAVTDAARTSIERLGAPIDSLRLASWAPVARPTDGIRASLTAGLRLFSGGVFVGATRKVDQAAHHDISDQKRQNQRKPGRGGGKPNGIPNRLQRHVMFKQQHLVIAQGEVIERKPAPPGLGERCLQQDQ
jgi:hypothetical protein